ncbi:MAG: hypothetical protein DHS20C17_31960 [Cyclobacteriaceae bacterium]|nr:MAG: hypothetical protein DHS20C17_31960 [Cyclobacteriaceae bacterium]
MTQTLLHKFMVRFLITCALCTGSVILNLEESHAAPVSPHIIAPSQLLSRTTNPHITFKWTKSAVWGTVKEFEFEVAMGHFFNKPSLCNMSKSTKTQMQCDLRQAINGVSLKKGDLIYVALFAYYGNTRYLTDLKSYRVP